MHGGRGSPRSGTRASSPSPRLKGEAQAEAGGQQDLEWTQRLGDVLGDTGWFRTLVP